MPKNLWLKRFDPDAEFVWRRASAQYGAGDEVVKSDFTPRRLKQLYEGRYILERDVWNDFVGVASSPAPAKGLPVVDPAPVDNGESDPIDELRADAESLGIDVDKRWGEKRLNAEIEKATAPASTLPGVNDGAA